MVLKNHTSFYQNHEHTHLHLHTLRKLEYFKQREIPQIFFKKTSIVIIILETFCLKTFFLPLCFTNKLDFSFSKFLFS